MRRLLTIAAIIAGVILLGLGVGYIVHASIEDSSAGPPPSIAAATQTPVPPTATAEPSLTPTVTSTATAVPTEAAEPTMTAVPPTDMPESTQTTEPSATTKPTEVVEATPVSCQLVIDLVDVIDDQGKGVNDILDNPGGFYYVADQYGNENPGIQLEANQPTITVAGIANQCGWVGSVRVEPSTKYLTNTLRVDADDPVQPGIDVRYLVLEPMPPSPTPTSTPLPSLTPTPTMTATATATLVPAKVIPEFGDLSEWVVQVQGSDTVIAGAASTIIYNDDGSGQFSKTNAEGQLQGTVDEGRSGRMSINHPDYTGIADLRVSVDNGQVLITGQGAAVDEENHIIYLSQAEPQPTGGTESNVNAEGCQDGDQVCQEQALVLFIPNATNASCTQGIGSYTAPAGTWVAFRGIGDNAGYIYHRTTVQSEQFEGWMCTVGFADGTSVDVGLNRICANAYIFPEVQPMVPVKPIPPKPQPETTPPPVQPPATEQPYIPPPATEAPPPCGEECNPQPPCCDQGGGNCTPNCGGGSSICTGPCGATDEDPPSDNVDNTAPEVGSNPEPSENQPGTGGDQHLEEGGGPSGPDQNGDELPQD